MEEGGGVQTLKEFTASELKRYLASLQDRGLAENSVKHAHTAAKAFANWAAREGHSVDQALLRVRAGALHSSHLGGLKTISAPATCHPRRQMRRVIAPLRVR